MKPELKPCPFCGSHVQTDFIEGESYVIECYGCDTRTDYHEDAESAIAAWNRRVPTEPVSDANCSECGKSAADGWALYCVACVEKINSVKLPSDDDIRAMWSASCASDFGDLTSDLVRHFARALLEKYGTNK